MTDYFVYNIFMQIFKLIATWLLSTAREYGLYINADFHHSDLGFLLNLFLWWAASLGGGQRKWNQNMSAI